MVVRAQVALCGKKKETGYIRSLRGMGKAEDGTQILSGARRILPLVSKTERRNFYSVSEAGMNRCLLSTLAYAGGIAPGERPLHN